MEDRELDIAVARAIGWLTVTQHGDRVSGIPFDDNYEPVPRYRDDISAALKAVERFTGHTNARITLTLVEPLSQHRAKYIATISSGSIAYPTPALIMSECSHESLAHALCMVIVRAAKVRVYDHD